MRRRDFISAAVLLPLAARAQQRSKIYRLGYLAEVRIPRFVAALQASLHDLGYVEDRNLKIEYRFGGETLDVLAAELAALGPDAIIALGTPPAIAAKRATMTIPIVMAAGDPLRAGIVASLRHPGGNITGVTMYGSELSGKRVEVLKGVLPAMARFAVLGNATNPFNQYSWEDTQPSARALGMEPQLFMVREPAELAAAFIAMQRTGAEAVIVLADNTLTGARQQIIALAAEHHLPAMYFEREYVQNGGLVSYGPNAVEVIRRSAALIDKVLKGAKPADLPIEQPTKFELVINLKTAKSLGLTISPSLLTRADEVIE
jgi:putative ABC transport system substrate-binding protein